MSLTGYLPCRAPRSFVGCRKMKALPLPWPFRRIGAGSSENWEKNVKDDGERRILDELGVTDRLCDFVRGFDVNTFKGFHLQDDSREQFREGSDSSVAAANVRKDLTEWQERHATLVLSKVKEISQLRYTLCPRHLKEQQFWRIYFLLVKNYVMPYEIRALQKAKLKLMAAEDSGAVSVIEVEMIETKDSSSPACLSQ